MMHETLHADEVITMVLLFHQFPCYQRCSEDHYISVSLQSGEWIGSECYFRGSDLHHIIFTVLLSNLFQLCNSYTLLVRRVVIKAIDVKCILQQGEQGECLKVQSHSQLCHLYNLCNLNSSDFRQRPSKKAKHTRNIL